MLVNEYLDSISLPIINKRLSFKRNYKKKSNSGYMSVLVKRKRNKNWKVVELFKPNLLTNSGRDWIHAQVYTNTSAGTVGANFIGVSANAVAPAVTDTTLTGEETTGGLARAAASPVASHTAGTNTSTVQVTYTASASFTAEQKAAVFNAASAGTMVHENTFTSTNLVSGDQLQLSWTMTLG